MNEIECEPVQFVADCPVRLATDLLAHDWDPVILSALRAGAQRRRDLLVAIGGISDKSLTESLRRLKRSGLLRLTALTPGQASYSLSELGESLANGPLAALGQWAVDRGHEVVAAQEISAGT
jgi:DNA-binding HxlR family transcriptional regulator